MNARTRYLEFLKSKGAIPKNYACGGRAYAEGGRVEMDIDIEEEEEEEGDFPMTFEDPRYNNHHDTSGAPRKGYAMGGRAGSYDEEEMKRHMVQSLKARRRF